jgi:RHS repeat-associated protein
MMAAYKYGPFGEDRGRQGPIEASRFPFRWSTKYADEETGLVYYGYRYYSPVIGRWTSNDPLDEHDGPNRAAFVGNDPVSAMDSFGLFHSRWHGQITRDGLEGSHLHYNCVRLISIANIQQDNGFLTDSPPFSVETNHGDNDSIEDTIGVMWTRLNDAQALLGSGDQCPDCQRIREGLRFVGMVLHAAQDLFSHSNFVELYPGRTWNVPVDGRPEGVFTGHYKWPFDNYKPTNKSHWYWNKDGPDTREGRLYFEQAKAAATQNTTFIWQTLVDPYISERVRRAFPKCCSDFPEE